MSGVSRTQTAGQLINRAAVSVGLTATADPFSSADPSFSQLVNLANECGEEFIAMYPWARFRARFEFTTAPGDTGIYDLPADFSHFINQTGWQEAGIGAAYPLLGPATAQWWAFLRATELYNVTIYAWFRDFDNTLQLYPQPPPQGINIAFEYMSRAWAIEGDSDPDHPIRTDRVDSSSDIVLFEPILFLKRLKLAFLQAKGFDTTKAQDEYNAVLDSWLEKQTTAPVLNLNGRGMGRRLLDAWVNVPETGFGN
jgi:hypothetical protein